MSKPSFAGTLGERLQIPAINRYIIGYGRIEGHAVAERKIFI